MTSLEGISRVVQLRCVLGMTYFPVSCLIFYKPKHISCYVCSENVNWLGISFMMQVQAFVAMNADKNRHFAL